MFRDNRVYLVGVAIMLTVLAIAGVTLEINTEQRVINISNLTAAQARKADLALYVRLLVDAESGQRGFLLTHDPMYLEPYEQSRLEAGVVLDRLSNSYLTDALPRTDANVREKWQTLRELSAKKMDELAVSVRLMQSNNSEEAIAMVRTDVGEHAMVTLRKIADDLDKAEDELITHALEEWQSGVLTARVMLGAATLLNFGLLIFVAFQMNRQLQRREASAQALESQTQELELKVRRRTEDLSALSSHLQQVSEREKAAIARELHDELGGLMVAAKLDVAWLEKRLARSEEDVAMRLKRLLKVLDDGLNMKRRVVETLRPTLLDNMGLLPALRWLYKETCGRAGLKCSERFPEDEFQLNDEAAIAVFRVIQESLTNIVKHAKASEVNLAIAVRGDKLEIDIRDNGIGMGAKKSLHASHGLASMRHRIESLGGEWRVLTPRDGGTQLHASLPISRVIATPAAAETS